MSIIKTNQRNLRHSEGYSWLISERSTEWKKKKLIGLRCINGIDAFRGHICASQGGGQQKTVLTQREGNHRRQGTFDLNNSDQKVLNKAEVDKSVHTFSPCESFVIISALTGKTTVPRASWPWFDKTRTPNNIMGKVCRVYQGHSQNHSMWTNLNTPKIKATVTGNPVGPGKIV